MQISSTVIGDQLQLTITGDVNNETSPELRQFVDDQWLPSIRRVAFDLSNVAYLSSSGISLLLETRLRAQRQQAQLSISRASNAVRDVLAACRLEGLLLSGM